MGNAADEAAKDAADMLRDSTSSLKAEDRIGPGIKGQCVKYEGTRYYEFCIKGKNAADMLRELALSNANAADEAAKDAADMLRDGTSSLKAEDRIGPGIKGQCVKYEGTRYHEFRIKGKNAADMLREL